MSDETPESDPIAELLKHVQRLEQRVLDLSSEVQELRAQRRGPNLGREVKSGMQSVEMWDDLWSRPLGELPDRVKEGDHWDMLWRDDPEDRLGDDDPDDDGGLRVPAKPRDLPPDRSGGIALPLPAEERVDVWDDLYPDDSNLIAGTDAFDARRRRRQD